jgi:23S rRNA G2069 N7-methylase RlmK/C1962 C5-methylase RlmI
MPSLLDVGVAGSGRFTTSCLNDVASEATHVDASSAYLKVATEEAKRIGA